MMTRRAKTGFMAGLMLVLSSWLIAQEILSQEFLEYLGDYQQIDGQWVDPTSFAESLEQMAQVGTQARQAQHDGQDPLGTVGTDKVKPVNREKNDAQ